MLPGVSQARKKDNSIYYRAGITCQGKHISLGSYPREAEAGQAYQDAGRILNDPAITLEHLPSFLTSLPFDKCVSLINFRDNRMYFKNPIYLKSKYFLYYLSPQEELKFDVDDLFYYSSHKLMRRGGHYFVSEYGMQTNILSRYGIKNFAVPGRDYQFVNGDPSDFRYSNLLVINPYYGVTRITQKGIVCYQTKLHIRGSHVIGVYETQELAAIAYNKAVDLAWKHGITKNYTTNYLTELSHREYAELYTQVTVSPRFLEYLTSRH
ncbi:MAG: hypothetical protein HFI42_05055 [Lachnospiraceae bacterium]|nr:hypothetical protein [Lachnospiraceae bacterium]MCI9149856.1 hypothetical protein [Lachnospiraceae bacterium]